MTIMIESLSTKSLEVFKCSSFNTILPILTQQQDAEGVKTAREMVKEAPVATQECSSMITLKDS